jgi:hypothetical protein
MVAPGIAGKASHLFVKFTGVPLPPDPGNAWHFTLMVNGVTSPVAVTLLPGETSGDSGSGETDIPPGADLLMRVTADHDGHSVPANIGELWWAWVWRVA